VDRPRSAGYWRFSRPVGLAESGSPTLHCQECYSIGAVYVSEAGMRAFAIILAVAATAACGPALAQTTTPNVVAPTPGLSTPVTSTTTNCMMSCNSQAANCQTRCYIPNAPGPPPNLNPASPRVIVDTAGASAACNMGCTSSQLACQSGCALNSPSP
jgi:hypothetical protein